MKFDEPIENTTNLQKIEFTENKDKNNTDMGHILSNQEKNKNIIINDNEYTDLLEESNFLTNPDFNTKKNFLTSTVVDNFNEKNSFKENVSVLKNSKIDLSSNLFDSSLDIESSFLENEMQNENENIYLSNIYNLFISLNDKIEKISLKESNLNTLKDTFKNVFYCLNNMKINEAKTVLKDMFVFLFGSFDKSCDINDNNILLSNRFFVEKINKILKNIKETIKIVDEIENFSKDRINELKNLFLNEIKKIKMETEESIFKEKRDREIFEMEVRKYLVSEYGINEKNLWESFKYLKEKFRKLENTKNVEESKDSKFKEKCSSLEKQIVKYKQEKELLNTKNNDLNDRISLLEKEINKIQNENVNLSESFNKLTEKNIKTKKEFVVLSNEILNYRDSNKKKSQIIEKQKKIIDILQSKISGNKNSRDYNFPIDDIKKNIRKLYNDLSIESDPKIREKIKKEIEDSQKRLKDFEIFNQNQQKEKR